VLTLTRNRTAPALGALLVAAATLAGCTTPTPTTPDGQPASAGQPSSAGQPVATQTTATAPAPACPVNAATLETAFKANTALASAIVLGGGLDRITCYQNYAVAHTTPTTVDPAVVLFVYDPATRTWSAVTAGTAMSCGQYVPPAVIAQLPGCADQ
jgi:hypothetical protein